MIHWKVKATTLLVVALTAFAAVGGGFHWRAMSAFVSGS